MPKLHMTDLVVSRLKVCGSYFDQTTRAFGRRVGKNRKTWFVIRGRERLRTNIGQYSTISLADARKGARKLLTEQPVIGEPLTFDEAYKLYEQTLKDKKPFAQAECGPNKTDGQVLGAV